MTGIRNEQTSGENDRRCADCGHPARYHGAARCEGNADCQCGGFRSMLEDDVRDRLARNLVEQKPVLDALARSESLVEDVATRALAEILEVENDGWTTPQLGVLVTRRLTEHGLIGGDPSTELVPCAACQQTGIWDVPAGRRYPTISGAQREMCPGCHGAGVQRV